MRNVTCTVLLYGAVLADGPAASGEEKPLPRITRLKKLYPATALAERGRARAFIVIPENPAFVSVANRVRDLIRRASGATLPVRKATELVDEHWKIRHDLIGGRNMIALGNVNNNRILSVLYGERYAVADSIYPGKGGHVVRTVHDPWATGVNIVVLAGSDLEGVERAVSVFADRYLKATRRTVVLKEPVVDVVFEKKGYPFFPDQTKSPWSKRQPQYRTLEEIRKRFPADPNMPPQTKGSFTGVTWALKELGDTYFRTGWKELLPMMKYRVEKYRACLKNPVERKRKSMGGRSSSHVHAWDLLEELPIWTDGERLDISNALLGDAALGHERRGFHGAVKGGYAQVLDENHGTFSAQRSFEAWHYFDKYYDIPESEYWMNCADAVFSAQASTFQILEDASGYLCYCPNSSMSYAMRSRDLTYLTRGVARNHSRFIALACINNLGLSSGFGDASGLSLWCAYENLAPAAWFYRDPYLYWVIRRTLLQNSGGRVFQNQMAFDLTVRPQEPKEWTGVIRIPCYENPLAKTDRRSKEKIYAPEKDVDPELFNKIVFKENWDRDGQYLLLDGAGVWGSAPGPHGHKHNDVNTIVNFTDEGRMWLVDHTYEQRAFQDHSGVDMLREGQSRHPERSLARLLNLEDGDTYGLTRTRIGAWERAVFWKKGRYFLVVDATTASADGEHLARCTFKTLGDEELRGTDLYLTQKGKLCKIASDGGAKLKVTRQDFTAKGQWRLYPHAEPVAKLFRQDKVKALKKGEKITFINLLYAYASKGQEDDVTMLPVTETCALVADHGAPTVMGMGQIPGGFGQAEMFVVSPGSVQALGCENPPASSAARRIIAAARTAAEERQQKAAASATQPKIDNLTVTTRELGMPVSSLVLFEASARGGAEWIAGGKKGLAAFTSRGTRVWSYSTKRDVRAIDTGDIDGDGRPEIVFGCDDNSVRALDMRGGLLWEFACKKSDPGGYNPPAVDYVRIDDLETDGKPDIVVGANWVHVLNPDGTVKWEQYMQLRRGRIAGDLTCCDVADIDGDGKKEVITGFLTSYSVLRAMDADGNVVLPVGFKEHLHPGLSLGPPLECRAVNLQGRGRAKQIVCVTKGRLCFFFHDQTHEPRSERSAKGQVKGPFTKMCVWQPDPAAGATIVTANDVYGLAAFEPYIKGRSIRTKGLWYKTLDEGITCLAAADLDGDGRGEVVVGTDGGNVYVFDVGSGAQAGVAKVHGAPVTALVSAAAGREVLAAKGDGTVLIIRK